MIIFPSLCRKLAYNHVLQKFKRWIIAAVADSDESNLEN